MSTHTPFSAYVPGSPGGMHSATASAPAIPPPSPPPPQLSEVQPQWSGSHPRGSLAKYRNDSASGRPPREPPETWGGRERGEEPGSPAPHTRSKAGRQAGTEGVKGLSEGVKGHRGSCPDHHAQPGSLQRRLGEARLAPRPSAQGGGSGSSLCPPETWPTAGSRRPSCFSWPEDSRKSRWRWGGAVTLLGGRALLQAWNRRLSPWYCHPGAVYVCVWAWAQPGSSNARSLAQGGPGTTGGSRQLGTSLPAVSFHPPCCCC